MIDIVVWFGLALPILLMLTTIAMAFRWYKPISYGACRCIDWVNKYLDGIAEEEW